MKTSREVEHDLHSCYKGYYDDDNTAWINALNLILNNYELKEQQLYSFVRTHVRVRTYSAWSINRPAARFNPSLANSIMQLDQQAKLYRLDRIRIVVGSLPDSQAHF